MIQYQSTPDFYRDYIAHKDHKYISKYRGPSGKWVYKYNDESQKSAYSDRKNQIQNSRENTERDYFRREQKAKENRKYAYPDRARQIKEARERAQKKYNHKWAKGTSYYRWRADAEGWKDDSSKQMKTLARRAGEDKFVGQRLTDARYNAYRKNRARTSVNATTKGYGKSSTQPSREALKIRERNRKAAERARKNRKAK